MFVKALKVAVHFLAAWRQPCCNAGWLTRFLASRQRAPIREPLVIKYPMYYHHPLPNIQQAYSKQLQWISLPTKTQLQNPHEPSLHPQTTVRLLLLPATSALPLLSTDPPPILSLPRRYLHPITSQTNTAVILGLGEAMSRMED